MISRYNRIFNRVLIRLKLRQFRLLVAVGQQGSIQHAARDLGISQPAATKMIQDMEFDFEVKLFNRTNRGVVPTVYGETLIRHSKLIFTQISSAVQELGDLNEGNTGRVVVGTLLAASPTLLPAAVDHLLQERPKVAIKIVEGTNEVLIPRLISGEIDMVVGRLSTHRYRTRVTQEKLFDERMLAVVGRQHELAQARSVTFEQLTAFGWILPPEETTLRRQTEQYFIKQNRFVPSVAIESVSYLANRSLLRNHDFVGLMPAHVATLDIERGLLVQVDWAVPFGAGPVGVSYRGEDSLSPAGRAFLVALRKAVDQLEIRLEDIGYKEN